VSAKPSPRGSTIADHIAYIAENCRAARQLGEEVLARRGDPKTPKWLQRTMAKRRLPAGDTVPLSMYVGQFGHTAEDWLCNEAHSWGQYLTYQQQGLEPNTSHLTEPERLAIQQQIDAAHSDCEAGLAAWQAIESTPLLASQMSGTQRGKKKLR